MFRMPKEGHTAEAEKSRQPGDHDFSSSQNANTTLKNPADAPSAPRAFTESEVMAREIKDGNLSGYVGSGTVVTGDTAFKGMMRVDGHVEGRLVSEGGTIIVGDGGQVDADLNVSVALIRGTVNGEIVASQRVELGRTAKVRGNIHTASLSIDHGAFFEGNCRMSPAKHPEKAAIGGSRTDRQQDYSATAANLVAGVSDKDK